MSRPMLAAAAMLAMGAHAFAGAQTELRVASPREVQMDRARRRASEPRRTPKMSQHDVERIERAQAKRVRKAAKLRAAQAAGGMA